MKQLLFFCLMVLSLFAKAQENKSPVKMIYGLKKNSETNYTIIAKANIEKGWHVFSTEPGGDGFLIPTSILLESSEVIQTEGTLKVDGKIITKDLPEVGSVNYVEGEVVFSINVNITSPKTTIKGTFTYQCCNDRMCLPPTDEVFTLHIK